MTAILQATSLMLPGRLDEVDLELAAGELTCVIGPNGGGKTSLLHAIAGVGAPSGHVSVDGTELAMAAPERRARLLTFVPASREMHWPLLARDLIGLGGADAGEVEQVIEALELVPFAGRRVDQLSTGERARVLIARGLAPSPRVLLLDEPTANLDPAWQIRLMDELKTRLRTHRQAALVAMHDLHVAERYADRIVVVNKGRLIADDVPARIFDGPVIRDVFGVERADGFWSLA